jgi:hypothetical protein
MNFINSNVIIPELISYLWQFESLSREDLIKLVRKQQAQFETTRKEAEESASRQAEV